ncbi:MAG TPA: LysR family transcriptional regulator [Ideonella sp.]|nr:LysR family transcriptional regulator [Ideonella sp.]
MNLRHLDLNLLVVLDALLTEHGATAAAQRLGVSQSTVSSALAKLRELFQDELFVKRPHGMEPTPRALELQGPVQGLMRTIREDILSRSGFDPAAAERSFVLVTGELGQLVFLHRILARIRAAAPRANVRVLACAAADRQAVLEEGRADLAVGYFPQFSGADLYQQLLYFSHPMVCIARTGHPALLDGQLTAEKFARLEHAVVGTEGNHPQIYEPVLKQLGIQRRVVVELPGFAGTSALIAGSDLIAIVPAALAQIYAQDRQIQTYPSPIAFPNCDVKQFWHRRVHHDPAVAWLRALIAEEFHGSRGAAESPAPAATRS